MSLTARLDLEHPVVQAGMGGGIAGPRLAGAVSGAGGLGTVGIMGPAAFGPALAAAQSRAGAGRAVAANLLVPFTRRAHVAACIEARIPVVVLHAGRRPGLVRTLRAAGIDVLATVGTAADAVQARRDGVSGLVAQGREAGGHLVGVDDTPTALAAVLDAADGLPVWAAGGVADAADVRRLLDAGADAVVAGTRFLLTEESGAHPEVKRRMVAGSTTVETSLFALGWPMRHRVLVNEAVERWGDGPRAVRLLNAASARVGSLLPLTAMGVFARAQDVRVPLFSPGPALAGMPASTAAVTPLYAGESVARMDDVVPAAMALARLAGLSGHAPAPPEPSGGLRDSAT